ncbi:MAG: S-layer protein, partial [Draconibacterium sp.]
MKNSIIFALLTSIVFFTSCSQKVEENKAPAIDKPALMWFDAEANFERFSYPDSIDFYLEKIKSIGFTDAVVDIRPITGEVLYKSDYAPQMKEWDGFERPDFDYLGYFIKKAHELGIRVQVSMNTFVGGHNFFDRGQVYTDHPEWA